MAREKYLYATGLLRSKENKLLDPNDVERMLDAPNAEQAFKVFNDTDYADNILDVPVKDFNRALEDDLKQTQELLNQIVPDEKILKILFLRYDFHNIKLFFKQKYLKKTEDEHASPLGIVEWPKIKQVILNRTKIDLPPEIQLTIDYINQRAEEEEVKPHLIARWADRQYFGVIHELAQQTKNKFIQDLIKLQIDIANLKTFIRGQRMQRSDEYIVSEILANGSLNLEDFTRLAKKSLAEALLEIKHNFTADAGKFIDHYLENRNLWELEKDLENLELDFVRQAKWTSYGPEVVISYYLAKKNAIRNVRLIMTGKINNIPAQELKEFKRDLF